MRQRLRVFMLFIIVLVFFYGLSTSIGNSAQKVFIRIEIKGSHDLQRLKQLPLSVHFRSEDYVLATMKADTLKALKEAGFTYKVIDERPWSQPYYVISRPQNLPLGEIPPVGKVIYQREREAVVKISEAESRELRKAGFRLARIFDRPLPLTVRERRQLKDLQIQRLQDPIIGAIVNRVSDATITAALQRLQDFQTRWSGSDSVYAAGQWLYHQFKKFGYQHVVFDTLQTLVEKKRQRNVIATKPGIMYPDSIIIIGGHYDSIVNGSGTNPAVWAPGADDNASGTVAVLEAARILADIDLKATVKFACWAAEEQGLIGSSDFVSRASSQGLNIGLYLNFDMMGYVDPADPLRDVSVLTDKASRGFAELMSEMAILYTRLIPQIGPSGGYSDHFYFQQHGYNAIYGEEGDFNVLNYHKNTDIIDNLNIPYINEVIRMGLATLIQVAGPPESIPGSFVTYNSYRFDDDLVGRSKGNNNGFLDAGETIELFVDLKNVGDSLTTGVTATLQTDDPFVLIISDSLKSYGDIAPGDSAINSEPFLFTISPQTPNDHSLVFSLKVRDSLDNSWGSFFLLKVLQPSLTYLGYSIEELAGDGDNIPDPGEVCHLFVTLENHGLRRAKGVSATLSTRDPDITVIDREATFTDIPVDSSGHNFSDPFTFFINAKALPHLVQFQLNVSEGEGYYRKPMEVRILLEQGPVLLVVDDGQADNSRFYMDALNELGVPTRKWPVAIRGSVPLDTLRNHADVIWFTGAEARETLTTEDQTNLATFLNQGGHLLLSGDFIGLRLAATSFYKDYLHARFVNVQTQLHHLRGIEGNPVTDIDTLALVASSTTLPTWPTEIDPLPPAFSIFVYDTTTAEGHGIIRSSGTAALAVNTSTFKVVYCSFSIESIISLKTRAAFLEDVLSWFKGAPIDLRAILSVASFTIDDDSSGASLGDGDGFINPGERIELSLSLANEGDLAASKVLVTMRTTDELITITDSTATFTIIPQHSVASSTDNFGFRVDASAPHEHEVPFEVSITDSIGNLWSDKLLLTIQHSNTIAGRVTDVATGQGIPEAEIWWGGSMDEQGVARQMGQVSTNESGYYSLSLPIGLYALTATAKGYVPSEQVYVELPPDTSLDFVLTSPEMAATPDSFVVHLDAGESFQDSLIISNTGTGQLFYSLLEISPTVAKVSQPPVPRLVGESPTKILSQGVRLSLSLPTPTASADFSFNKGTPPNPGQWKLMHLDPDEPEVTLDLDKFYIQNDSKDIFFKQTVHQAWNNPTSDLIYVIFMDTDMNPGTGASINNMGADYAIALGYFGDLILRWTPATEDFNPIPGNYIPHHVVLPLQADSLEVGIHLTQIGNPQRLDIVNVMMTPSQIVEDVAPDNGLYHIPYSTFDANWLWESSFYGLVKSGDRDTIILSFNTEGLSSGNYKAHLVIENNQPEGAARVIPVQLTVGPTVVDQAPAEVLPEVYELHQNYPNPFSVSTFGQNQETVIKYQLPKDGEVVLKVYNMLGQEVATLVHEHKKAGYFEAKWDGKDQYGRMCASGIYFYRITAGDFVQTRKMLLLQ